MNYTAEMLEILRREVETRVSAKRFSHILGVERCAAELGMLLLPDSVSELRAAALLHDVAKEIPIDKQIEILKSEDYPLTEEDIKTTGVIHSFTAPIVIKKDFPLFATKDILSAVERHTVGGVDMTVFEKIIFVADYAEDTRTYQSCITVRKMLFEGLSSLPYKEREMRLNEACLAAINGASDALRRMGLIINSRMQKTKNSLLGNKL